jgi:hypothetical protein
MGVLREQDGMALDMIRVSEFMTRLPDGNRGGLSSSGRAWRARAMRVSTVAAPSC